MGVVCTPPTVIGLEDQLPLVPDEQAVDVAGGAFLGGSGIHDLGGGGQLIRKIQDQVGVSAIRAKRADGNPVLLVLGGDADVGLLQIRKLRLERPGNILGIEGGNLGCGSVAELRNGGGERDEEQRDRGEK